ncbi:MAG: B12-binding domain-containing radical SAM protein [Methylococcus sp.]|nr:MAG: B12-binding domain-containing radical SAM protein [Methylococcus sp.]
MRCLLVYPKFPKTFWSFEAVLELIDRKVTLPPLGLVTVAAMLPQEWEYKLVDCNIRPVTDEEWEWADLVVCSAMVVQKEDLYGQIREAKRRDKSVAVGGPYATSVPEDMHEAGADFLVLDEGEITIPLFLEALERGETCGVFRSDGVKPDVTQTPIPRFDLYELEAYDSLSVQYSRGCPFLCEFCDIINLYGRRPRTKTPDQMMAELDTLYELGWRRCVFMVDDNFIGNKKNAKGMLRVLQGWQEDHGYPFSFMTEASVDLALDKELMRLMVACNFESVFLGIETPDEESLNLTRKYQNIRSPLAESVDTIIRAGLRPMGGFIIGFDGEKPGAGERINDFVEETAIPTPVISMLQVLPNTALWDRYKKEGRLLVEQGGGDINNTTLTNFVTDRPVDEIAKEFVQSFLTAYDANTYIDRVYRCFLKLGPPVKTRSFQGWMIPELCEIRVLLTVIVRQGILRKTRWKYWHHGLSILFRKPAVLRHYLILLAHYEHHVDFRHFVSEQIRTQLENLESQSRELAPMTMALAENEVEKLSEEALTG